ncbi:MAG: TrkH family potassium uptake protein [Candidatus Avelusimicrobium sp.]|uniref:TrkH family potassium uptake protein n=1 Tax=Candidatus Avelusimicrobium sp. TaxID=3048833 RepID=UPI003EFE9C14
MAKINWREAYAKTKEFIKISFKKYTLFLVHLTPHQNIAQTILAYTFLGWIALSLPFMNTTDVSLLDNLFTSAAAVSTTGLNSVNFADSYTFLGKLVVLILIQIGGVGYMTFSSFVYLSFSERHRLRKYQQENLNAEVSLPKTLKLSDFLWAAIGFTVIAELIGAVFLFNYFRHHDFGMFDAAWYGIFHSVSAFCTAGFSLWPNSLENFADSKTMNIVISCLALSGAMGFIVVTDVFNFIRRKTKQISFTTKIIVIATAGMVSFGTFTLFVTTPGITLLEAFFQSVCAMTTAGFNTVNVGGLSSCSLLILVLLMNIGGSPSGTAGGMKTTTFCSMLAIMYNRLRLNTRVEFLGRRLPLLRLYAATSMFLVYAFFLFVSVFLLTWTEDLPFIGLVFESSAALGTAGLSTGITSQLSALGKLIIIATMIVGRIGVVTFGMALLAHDKDDDDEDDKPVKTEDVAV